MNQSNRKPTLVMLLFPVFESVEARRDFEIFLKMALTVSEGEIRVLEQQKRYTSRIVHKFLRDQAQEWGGRTALICFAGTDDVTQAASKIGTLDQFVPLIRSARKVLVTGPNALDRPFVIDSYPSPGDDGMLNKPLFTMRTGPPPYPISTARELANYLGTRDRPQAATESSLAVTTSQREDEPTAKQELPKEPKERGDITQVGFEIREPGTGKVVGMQSSNPDDEADQPTMKPPAPKF